VFALLPAVYLAADLVEDALLATSLLAPARITTAAGRARPSLGVHVADRAPTLETGRLVSSPSDAAA
jgi:hypothetical protein